MDLDFIQNGQLNSKKGSQTKDSPQGLKIFSDLKEAFKQFDDLDEESARGVAFVVQQKKISDQVLVPNDELFKYLLTNALLLIDAGELGLARNVLGDILRRDSNHIEAIRWMGWSFKAEGDFLNALTCYVQLTNRRVSDQDLFELGEIYYALKRDSEALATWLEGLGQCHAESSHLFDLHKNLGNVFMRMGDLESAEENYNKALTIRPLSDILHVNLGSLQLQSGNKNQALGYFKKALELNPHNDRAWCGVALVAKESNDTEWANAVLSRALDINPLNQTALQILIGWAQVEGKFSQAIRRVQSYVDRFTDDSDMLYSLAGLHFQNDDFESAELELTRLEALDPERQGISELKILIAKKLEARKDA